MTAYAEGVRLPPTAATPPTLPTAPTTRERVLDAAVRLTVDDGWSRVTMGRVADATGVSRQTVHHEVRTKDGLAEAMIRRELDRFLAVVAAALDAHPDDLVAAIRSAAHGVLEHARDNRLLHAVVSATHGADTELLPLLTTHADSLLDAARAVVLARVAPYGIGLEPERLHAAVDVVVRVVLSHVMQPTAEPAATADDIAWVAGRLLA